MGHHQANLIRYKNVKLQSQYDFVTVCLGELHKNFPLLSHWIGLHFRIISYSLCGWSLAEYFVSIALRIFLRSDRPFYTKKLFIIGKVLAPDGVRYKSYLPTQVNTHRDAKHQTCVYIADSNTVYFVAQKRCKGYPPLETHGKNYV